jgi:hypothetical protein
MVGLDRKAGLDPPYEMNSTHEDGERSIKAPHSRQHVLSACDIICESPCPPRHVFLALREFAMSQAIVDPAELRRFAANLKRFNADLQAGLAGLHGQLVALGDSWRDQEHDRFRQEFEATMLVLDRFLIVAEEHIPFLVRKAERIEDYLQQR